MFMVQTWEMSMLYLNSLIDLKRNKGRTFKIQGNGSETRSFIYIDDFAKAFECILKRKTFKYIQHWNK